MSKLNPNDETHLPNLSEFVRIMYATGDTSPLEALCALFGGRFVTRSPDTAKSVMHAVLHVASEGGDVVTEVNAALDDDVITDAERLRIKREITEQRAALTQLENTIDKAAELKAVK